MLGHDRDAQDGGLVPDYTPDSQVRNLTLMLCVVTWFLIGLGILLGYSPDTSGAYHIAVPTPLRVAEWWFASALASLTLITGRPRYWTILALMIGPTIRATSYVGAWVLWLIPGGTEGSERGLYVATIHLPLMWIVVILALLLRPSASEAGGAR